MLRKFAKIKMLEQTKMDVKKITVCAGNVQPTVFASDIKPWEAYCMVGVGIFMNCAVIIWIGAAMLHST